MRDYYAEFNKTPIADDVFRVVQAHNQAARTYAVATGDYLATVRAQGLRGAAVEALLAWDGRGMLGMTMQVKAEGEDAGYFRTGQIADLVGVKLNGTVTSS